MSTRIATRAATGRRRARLGATAGMVGAAGFVAVFTVEGWRRPGHHPSSMFVSELSLGPSGWVQITNFLVTGAMIFTFGRGLAAHFRDGPGSLAGPVLVQIIGMSLLASGPFTTDPSAMFNQVSAHGLIHGVFGALVFALAPVSCFVFHRRFREDPAWRPVASWTLAAGVILTVGDIALKASQAPSTPLFPFKGLVQRAILVTFMGWLFAVAARTYRQAFA